MTDNRCPNCHDTRASEVMFTTPVDSSRNEHARRCSNCGFIWAVTR